MLKGQSRLNWSQPADGRRFEGVWWPHSRDAAAELRIILPAVDEHLGRPVRRVSISTIAWTGEQPRWITVGDHVVHLGWFEMLNPSTVSVARATGDCVRLLIIPPETSDRAAGSVVQRVTGPVSWTGNAHTALQGTSNNSVR